MVYQERSMSDQNPTPEQLEAEIARLTARVWTLEQTVAGLASERARSTATPAAAPAPSPQAPYVVPPVRTPSMAPSRPDGRPQPPAPPQPVWTLPARDPIDWGKVAERVFTARPLAWAGAVAAVLGVVLLFVLAASRGWVTPPMRLGIGVIVSVALLGVAIELDRRSWRADAILAAAGAGIAGLYATLWAAASLYGYVGAAGASGLAAAIAALAVIVAIRFEQEPLAVFGVSGAMLAPVLVGSGGGPLVP